MKIFYKFIFIICSFLLISCSKQENILDIFFFDVKQGDSSFINYNDISILVDTGESIFTDTVVDILKSKYTQHRLHDINS